MKSQLDATWYQQYAFRVSEVLKVWSRDSSKIEDVVPIDIFRGDYKQRQVECAVELYGHMGIQREDKAGRLYGLRRNFEFFDAPHIAIICMESSFGIGVALDVGMYVQTLMLAMQTRGIGSCAQASMRHYPDIVRQELGIRDDLRILCGVAFGYEDQEVPANRTVQARTLIENSVLFLD